jgi:PEP-CTERM motif
MQSICWGYTGDKTMKILLATLALALLAATASADTWTYTGNAVGNLLANPEGNTANGFAIDGTVTFAAPLVPFQQSYPIVSFSFTQGSFTFDNSNSTLNIGPFAFGQTTPFLDWIFSISDAAGLEMSSIRYDIGESTDFGPAGSEQGNPGIWTDTVSTPEPSTLALLGLGLLALISRGRKRAKVSSVWEPLA